MSEEKFRKLFVGGLDQSVSEDELKNYFSNYGEVESCVILQGFGFVVFQNAETVDLVQAGRPHAFKEREVQLKRAVPKKHFKRLGGHLTVSRLFVGGIGDQVEPEQLTEYFEQFGPVNRVEVVENRQTGHRRGFAFIDFNDYDPVDKAVLRGPHTINGRTVEVRKAMTRFEMRLLKERNQRDFSRPTVSEPRLLPLWQPIPAGIPLSYPSTPTFPTPPFFGMYSYPQNHQNNLW